MEHRETIERLGKGFGRAHCRPAFILVMCAALAGCADSGIEFVGLVESDFHGLLLEWPHGTGVGVQETTTSTFEFKNDEFTLTVTDLGMGNFEIHRNGELLGTANEGQRVQFDDDGMITVHSD